MKTPDQELQPKAQTASFFSMSSVASVLPGLSRGWVGKVGVTSSGLVAQMLARLIGRLTQSVRPTGHGIAADLPLALTGRANALREPRDEEGNYLGNTPFILRVTPHRH
jgi:hypothetical protein